MELWMHHLILNILAPAGLGLASVHLARDTAQSGEPGASRDPQAGGCT